MEEARGQAVCGQEALDLLNCIAQSPYDQDKCLRLMNSLRECVLNKKVKKFSLADQQQKDAKPADQQQKDAKPADKKA